jgi:uncharacterized membrane protein YkvA (DUF1232 family)
MRIAVARKAVEFAGPDEKNCLDKSSPRRESPIYPMKPDPENIGPRGTDRYKGRAAAYLNDPQRAASLLEKAQRKLGGLRSGALAGLWDQLQTLVRMVRAYVSGEYRGIPWQSILLVTAAVVYFVSPFDFIPDFLGPMGFADDAAVIAWVLSTVANDLDDFREWEKSRGVRQIS